MLYIGSGALNGKLLIVSLRVIENNKIDAFYRSG